MNVNYSTWLYSINWHQATCWTANENDIKRLIITVLSSVDIAPPCWTKAITINLSKHFSYPSGLINSVFSHRGLRTIRVKDFFFLVWVCLCAYSYLIYLDKKERKSKKKQKRSIFVFPFVCDTRLSLFSVRSLVTFEWNC